MISLSVLILALGACAGVVALLAHWLTGSFHDDATRQWDAARKAQFDREANAYRGRFR